MSIFTTLQQDYGPPSAHQFQHQHREIRAFAEPERVLKARISRMKPDEFFEDLEGRLGTAPGGKALTLHHYRDKARLDLRT